MACPAKTRTQGKTTYTNTIMTEWKILASVPLILATCCTGNSSMYCIRRESKTNKKIHFNNETLTKEQKTFHLPGFYMQRTLFHKIPLFKHQQIHCKVNNTESLTSSVSYCACYVGLKNPTSQQNGWLEVKVYRRTGFNYNIFHRIYLCSCCSSSA